MSTMKLNLVADLPEAKTEEEARTIAARLLRDAADRLDKGMSFGGFHQGGYYMVGDFLWKSVGSTRPEPGATEKRWR